MLKILKINKRSNVFTYLILLALLGALIQAALAESSSTVFELGRLDGSSREFAGGYPPRAVRVDANDPSAARQWYAFQPISDTVPREIVFSIAGEAAPVYTIRIGILIEHASVPALRVKINQHEGLFYLDPKLDSRVDGGSAVSFPAFSQAIVTFKVPGSFLREGENTIALSAVAQGDGEQVPDAGLNYDAIEMFEGAQANDSEDEIHIKPTVFYKLEHNRLEEGIDVTLRHGSLPVRSASVTINGTRITLPINKSKWGEQRMRIYVPAFQPHTQVRIELNRDGKTDTLEQVIDPAKRWTVYVAPHVHLDIGYTDYQAKVAAVQGRVIDEALDLIDLHPEFRFSVDGMWSIQQFMDTRTDADKARAIAAMKAKQLFAPVEYANVLTGFASGETLIRSLYAGAQFSRTNGTPLNYANITDVPSYSWSYASILASAGIHELLAGANNGRAPVLLRSHLDETSPFYWQGPDGQKVLMWYARHYHQMWTIFGLPPLVNAGEQILPLFLQMYGRPTYKASSTLLYGSQVENTDLFPEQAELVEHWNRQYAYPHLRYSGFHQALTSIASEFNGDIPTVKGDGGPYWEDGIAADAYYAAMERKTEARGPSAEKLSTIGSLENPRLAVDKSRLDAMWRNMVLMDEHTWTASESYSDSENDQAKVQLAVKDSTAMQASELSDWLLRHAMADLADCINTPAHSLVVFNTLNWPRSGIVSVDVRKGYGIFDSTTGQSVPIELTSRGENTNRARFWAEDVPAVGYKTYLLRPVPDAGNNTQSSEPLIMENQFYKVELDPATGAVRSIFDKELGHELVDQSSPYRLGEYLYVTTDNTRQGADRFVVHGAHQGKLVSIEHSPDGVTARLISTDINTPRIAASITLSSHEKKILLTEGVDKKETKDDEGVYFAFPFAMSHPQFQYEIQNGVVDPSRDMYPGAGLDWFSVQHWAAVRQDGISATVMPLDASLMTFGDISRISFPETFGERKGTIFSYVMNNYWHTNYRAEQGGHFQFRYVVTSASTTDAVQLSHQAWEEMTPLEVTEVTASDKAVETKRPLDGKSTGFLTMNDPALLLETWKPAEDGNGTILRLLDLGGTRRTVRVGFPLFTLEHAWLDDALERDQKAISPVDPHTLELIVTPHAILTVRVLNKIAPESPCGRFCAAGK
jgi:hypothetical protein